MYGVLRAGCNFPLTETVSFPGFQSNHDTATSSLPADPGLDADGPLSLLTTQLSYEPDSEAGSISVELRDNLLALEAPRVVSFGIVLSSSQCYDLAIAPTLITILDDDGMHTGPITTCTLCIRSSITCTY